jgi:uncharacterized protein YndB with AHSA1/START domain
MAETFGATVTIDRPIEAVFDFLANGENDKKFSSRVVEIHGRRDEVQARIRLTEFERPTKLRWREISKMPSLPLKAVTTSSPTAAGPRSSSSTSSRATASAS